MTNAGKKVVKWVNRNKMATAVGVGATLTVMGNPVGVGILGAAAVKAHVDHKKRMEEYDKRVNG